MQSLGYDLHNLPPIWSKLLPHRLEDRNAWKTAPVVAKALCAYWLTSMRRQHNSTGGQECKAGSVLERSTRNEVRKRG
jgi:hypothetical protein